MKRDIKLSRRRTVRPGFMLAEFGVGLAIVAALAGSLAVIITRQQRGSQQLADHRAAIRAAETALEDLRTGQTVSASTDLAVERLSDPSPVAGRAWVTVRSTVNGRTIVLTALVPDRGANLDTQKPSTREAR